MADVGYSLQEAGAQLGHTSATMTEWYSGIYPERLEARSSLLDSLRITIVLASESSAAQIN